MCFIMFLRNTSHIHITQLHCISIVRTRCWSFPICTANCTLFRVSRVNTCYTIDTTSIIIFRIYMMIIINSTCISATKNFQLIAYTIIICIVQTISRTVIICSCICTTTIIICCTWAVVASSWVSATKNFQLLAYTITICITQTSSITIFKLFCCRSITTTS